MSDADRSSMYAGQLAPRRLIGVVTAGHWFLCDDERPSSALRIEPTCATEESVCGVELLDAPSAMGAEVRLCRVFGQRASLRAESDAILWRACIDLDFYSARARLEHLPAAVAQDLVAVRLRTCTP